MSNMYIRNMTDYLNVYFPIVRASTLSLDDEFLKHEPESDKQRKFKSRIIEIIKSGIKDFRAQSMDPTLDEEGKICFKSNVNPSSNKSPNWWKENAKKFMPQMGSRLGTLEERIAFLAVLMKYLIEERNYTIKDAWIAICDDSRYLANYINSPNGGKPENTGKNQIGKWCDLGNTSKFLYDEELEEFSFISTYWGYESYNPPLASIKVMDCLEYDNSYFDTVFAYAVGWIVLPVI